MRHNIFAFLLYIKDRANVVFDGFTRELSENRVILNWMYCLAYLALIFYCATTNKSSHNTAIVTTGGIVGSIFTVYVLGASYEKVQIAKTRKKMTPEEEERAAGD